MKLLDLRHGIKKCSQNYLSQTQSTVFQYYINSVCTKGSCSLNHPEVNHTRGSYVYTMGILYRPISTRRTKQLVNWSRHYVSTKPLQRLLNQELVEVTVFQLIRCSLKTSPCLFTSRELELDWHYLPGSGVWANFTILVHALAYMQESSNLEYRCCTIVSSTFLLQASLSLARLKLR